MRVAVGPAPRTVQGMDWTSWVSAPPGAAAVLLLAASLTWSVGCRARWLWLVGQGEDPNLTFDPRPARPQRVFVPSAAEEVTRDDAPTAGVAGAPVPRGSYLAVPEDVSDLTGEASAPGEEDHTAAASARVPDVPSGSTIAPAPRATIAEPLLALESAWEAGDAERVAALAAHEPSWAWCAWVTAASMWPNSSRSRHAWLAWEAASSATPAAQWNFDAAGELVDFASWPGPALVPAEARDFLAELRLQVPIPGVPARALVPVSPTGLLFARAATAAGNADLEGLLELTGLLGPSPLADVLAASCDPAGDVAQLGVLREDVWGLLFSHLRLMHVAQSDPPQTDAAASRLHVLLRRAQDGTLPGGDGTDEDTDLPARVDDFGFARDTEVVTRPRVVVDAGNGIRVWIGCADMAADTVYWQASAAWQLGDSIRARRLLARIGMRRLPW